MPDIFRDHYIQVESVQNFLDHFVPSDDQMIHDCNRMFHQIKTDY